MSKTIEQSLIRDLHERALFADVDPKTALMYLKQALEGYGTLFDKGRAARDLGRFEFRVNNPEWVEHLQQSIYLLEDALHETDYGSEDESRVLREQAATHNISGRLLLSAALRENDPPKYHDSVKFFTAAKEELRKSSGNTVLPDQYEINSSAAHVIAERYKGGRVGALRLLGRAALIAPLSESGFVRHHRKGLSIQESLKIKRQAVGRAAFAAKLVFRGNTYIQNQSVRLKAAEMVA